MLLKSNCAALLIFALISGTSSMEASQSSSPISQETSAAICKGIVRDASGEPLIGVAVRVKNNHKIGISTDMNGEFSLPGVKKGDALELSYIGYTPLVVKWEGKNLDVEMQEETQGLDEVVVVGYGTSTKRSLISSVSKVDTKGVATAPVVNVTEALAGRSPGLIIQGSGGGVNKSSSITIRGGNTPLVVIDGVIRSYSDFQTLLPTDIESISILKDASSTAVYGSRAANGILQIVTKKGKEGKVSINYSYNLSLSQPALWRRRLGSSEIAELANIAYADAGLDPAFTQEQIQKYKDGSDPLNYPNTNWRSLTMRDWAPTNRHNISMNGGNEVNNFAVSFGYLDQESLYKINTHNMQRYNLRLSQTSYISKIGLRETAIIDGYVQEYTHPYTSTSGSYWEVFSHVQNKSPMAITLNKHGLPYLGGDNPVAEIAEDAGYNRSTNRMANAKLELAWDLPWVKGLNVRGAYSYRYNIDRNKRWRKDAAQYDWDSTTPQYAGQPQLSRTTSSNYSYTWQWFVDYNNKFGKNELGIFGGYEATYGLGESEYMSRTGYTFDIDQFSSGPESTTSISASESEYGRAGWIGQVKYNYDQKYFVEGSLRYDGSDLFPKKKRWGTFWAGSIGWSIDRENFMASLRDANVFNMLKFRASYGEVGSDSWSSPYSLGRYEYLTSYGYSEKGYVIDGQYYGTFYEGSPASTEITWFTNYQTNVGFDFSSLNNRLYGSADYFYYRTKGFIYAPADADAGYYAPLGTSLPKVSTDGEFRRAGWEFQLGWQGNIGDFNYYASVNYTYYNKLWANNPSESITSQMNPRTRGVQTKDYYTNGLHCLGFFTSDEEIRNSALPANSYNLRPGDLKYEDVNGDGVIDGSDYVHIGKGSFPHSNYGITLGGNWKGFTINLLFQGAGSFDMYLGSYLQKGEASTYFMPMYEFQTDYWTPDNPNAKFPRLSHRAGEDNGSNNYLTSDFWLINGSYFRFKDFSIAYDFKYSLLRKYQWLSKLQVLISGQNIFTISEANKYGLDPENGSTQGFAYPNERTFSFGVNIGF